MVILSLMLTTICFLWHMGIVGIKKAYQDHCIDKNMTTLMMISSLRQHILQQLKDLIPSLRGQGALFDGNDLEGVRMES